MTTPDDYLIIETTAPEPMKEEEQTNEQTNEEEQEPELIQLRFQFPEHGAYDMRTLAYTINTLMIGQLVPVKEGLPIDLSVDMDSTNRLVIYADKEFTIIDASYRVKLLLGLYDTQLPISSTQKQLLMPSVPYVSYGNVLYLTARTDFVSVLNKDDKEVAWSIAYKVNELLYPGYPIQSKLPGQWSIIRADQLQSLEFTLCDFRLQPVVLHAPMCITIDIERLDNMNQLNTPDKLNTDFVGIK